MTNPTLLRAVRERMSAQTTEQLLDLWVTNDRATWSPEAFEAAKQILAERGQTHLPPQNDPAPVAGHFKPTLTAEAQYWLGWLRPLMWMAIVASALRLVRAPLTAWRFGQTLLRPLSTTDTPAELLVGLATDVLLPGCLLVAAIGCLKLKPWARMMLLWLPLAVLALNLWQFSGHLSEYQYDRTRGVWILMVINAARLEVLVGNLWFPLILLLVMRRPEIRALFLPSGGGFGVDAKAPD